ncbi:hypothetical protein [Microbacterium croceum]|uniref:hypothetical protein n=1 Tax=Microbacterium croceum TaxID=2851645 RepID=UPI00355844D0
MNGESYTGHAPGSPLYRRLIAGLFFAGITTFAQLYSTQAVLPQMLGRDRLSRGPVTVPTATPYLRTPPFG